MACNGSLGEAAKCTIFVAFLPCRFLASAAADHPSGCERRRIAVCNVADRCPKTPSASRTGPCHLPLAITASPEDGRWLIPSLPLAQLQRLVRHPGTRIENGARSGATYLMRTAETGCSASSSLELAQRTPYHGVLQVRFASSWVIPILGLNETRSVAARSAPP